MRILFVDDELVRHKKIEQALFDFDHELVHACGVEEAFTFIKDDVAFDIISLDHDMGPNNNDTGYYLIQKLCNDIQCVEKMKAATIFIHSFNIGGALNMRGYLQHFGLSAELIEFGENLMRRIKEIAYDRIRFHQKMGE